MFEGLGFLNLKMEKIKTSLKELSGEFSYVNSASFCFKGSRWGIKGWLDYGGKERSPIARVLK